MVQRKRIRLGTMGLRVRFMASLSGLRIQCCCELWCSSQTWLRSCLLWQWWRLAAGSWIRPLAWEPPHAVGATLGKAKKKKNTIDWGEGFHLKCQETQRFGVTPVSENGVLAILCIYGIYHLLFRYRHAFPRIADIPFLSVCGLLLELQVLEFTPGHYIQASQTFRINSISSLVSNQI